MEKFGWDMNFILSRAEYYKDLTEKSEGTEKEKYKELRDNYSILMFMYLNSIGKTIYEKISDDQKLLDIRRMPRLSDYDDFSLEIQKSIFSKINRLESNLPYVRYSKSIDLSSAIKYIQDAIHDIFGEAAYNHFLAITKSNSIQIGNEDTSTCVIHIPDPDYENTYILLKMVRSIELVKHLSHEFGHDYRLFINSSIIPHNHLLLEYESFSYEFRILDYFINNGIYKEEAIKTMIRMINWMDCHAYLIQHEELLSLSISELTRKAHELDIYNRIHIPNNEVLLDALYTLTQKYSAPYIYSAMVVFDDLEHKDDMSRYEYIINNIGKVEEEKLINEAVSDPKRINDLSGYKEYRKKIRKLYDEHVKNK